MKTNILLILLITIINICVSCGKNTANADQGFTQINLYGYVCITNYSALWCDNR